MKKNYVLFFAFLFLTLFASRAQDGQLDPDFGPGGYVQTDLFGLLDFGFSVAIQSNGNIIAAGGAEMVIDRIIPTVASYLPDGSLNTSFGSDGIVTTDFNTPFAFDAFYDVLIQEDQKIVAGGSYGVFGSQNVMLVRYLVDGSLDPSFGTNGIATVDLGDDDRFSAMGITDDGKILSVGVSKISGVNQLTLMRFLIDGNLDPTFGDNGIQATGIFSPIDAKLYVQLLENNDLLVSGKIIGGSQLVKFDSEGILDTNFGDDGTVSTEINSFYVPFSVTPEGDIVVGMNRDLGNDEFEGVLKRYLANGSLDTTFGDDGVTIIDYENFRPKQIIIQPNKLILILGAANFGVDSSDTVLTRYRPTGEIDTSFGQVGSTMVSEIDGEDMLLQEDGKIVFFGSVPFDWDFFLARYLNDPFTFGIEDQDVASLAIFPNPSNGMFKIQHDFIFNSGIEYQVHDVSGKVIVEGILSESQTTIDLSAAQSGLFFLNASGKVFRLIKN